MFVSKGVEYPQNISRQKDKLIELFTEFISKNETAKEFYDSIDKSILCENMINELISETGSDVDEKAISEFILNGVVRIDMILGQQSMCEDNGIQMDW